MFNWIKNLFKKEKIEPPDPRAIVKLNDDAKENGIYDDENKIIEITRNGVKEKIKYSEADVEVLRENGIPVADEEYSEDYDFIDAEIGGVEYRK
mgnify:CR=1 FL=1